MKKFVNVLMIVYDISIQSIFGVIFMSIALKCRREALNRRLKSPLHKKLLGERLFTGNTYFILLHYAQNFDTGLFFVPPFEVKGGTFFEL